MDVPLPPPPYFYMVLFLGKDLIFHRTLGYYHGLNGVEKAIEQDCGKVTKKNESIEVRWPGNGNGEPALMYHNSYIVLTIPNDLNG